MSKKSRKRNKKILAALALAGGAAMLARGRGKGAVSTAGQPVGVDRMSTNTPPIGGIDHMKKAVAANAAADAVKKSSSNYLGRMKGGNPDDPTGEIGQKVRANWAQNKRYVNPNEQTLAAGNAYVPRIPRVHVGRGRKDGGRIEAKHGGRVTGIAKRGFGRALMKGKK